MRYSFIRQHRQQFRIAAMCRVLQVSPSGYYAWRDRPESARRRANRGLTTRIKVEHARSRKTYGRRRIHARLRAQGVICSPNRVSRLMRQAGLWAHTRRRFRPTTDSKHGFPVAPNRLLSTSTSQLGESTRPTRNFTVSDMNQVWLSDITYLPSDEGWLYLATVMDLCNRQIVGWSMQPSITRHLTLNALKMAITQRRPAPGLIHHSDQGSQYACFDYQAELQEAGMLCSMSRKGDPWDNAPQESFYRSLKSELPQRRHQTHAQAKREVFDYIEVFYNRQRLHSALGYQSPVTFERSLARTT
jgi:transposase InsO family protein